MNIDNFNPKELKQRNIISEEITLTPCEDLSYLQKEVYILKLTNLKLKQELADLKQFVREFKPTLTFTSVKTDYDNTTTYKATLEHINGRICSAETKVISQTIPKKFIHFNLLHNLRPFTTEDLNIIDLT